MIVVLRDLAADRLRRILGCSPRRVDVDDALTWAISLLSGRHSFSLARRYFAAFWARSMRRAEHEKEVQVRRLLACSGLVTAIAAGGWFGSNLAAAKAPVTVLEVRLGDKIRVVDAPIGCQVVRMRDLGGRDRRRLPPGRRARRHVRHALDLPRSRGDALPVEAHREACRRRSSRGRCSTVQIGPHQSEGLLPNLRGPSAGSPPTAAVASAPTVGAIPAVVSTPAIEPLSTLPGEVRRLGIDHAQPRRGWRTRCPDLVQPQSFSTEASIRSHWPRCSASRSPPRSGSLPFGALLSHIRSCPSARSASGLGTAVGGAIIGVLDQQLAVGLHVSAASLVLFALGVFCSVLVWDWFVELTLDARKRVLLVGSTDADALLAEELRTTPHARFDLVGAVSASEELTEIVNAQSSGHRRPHGRADVRTRRSSGCSMRAQTFASPASRASSSTPSDGCPSTRSARRGS